MHCHRNWGRLLLGTREIVQHAWRNQPHDQADDHQDDESFDQREARLLTANGTPPGTISSISCCVDQMQRSLALIKRALGGEGEDNQNSHLAVQPFDFGAALDLKDPISIPVGTIQDRNFNKI